MKQVLSLLSILLIPSLCKGQLGGEDAFRFLTTTSSARVAASGGYGFANPADDLNFAIVNPANLRSDLSGQLGLNFVTLPAGIRFAEGGYVQDFEGIGTFSGSMKYITYGDFIRANALAQTNGLFFAGEYMLQFGYGYQLDSNWQFGSNIKIINATYDTYSSWALASDWAVNYQIPKRRWAFSLLLRNLGTQLTTFNSTKESLPLQLDLSIYKRLAKAPIAWYITFENLQKFDLYYSDPNSVEVDPITGEEKVVDPSVFNRFLRHVVIGGEVLLGKSLNLQVGYRFRRQFEMALPTRRTSSGFTFGFGFKISKFRLNYANTNMNVSGRMHSFSIVTSLDEFSRKKKD